LKRRFLGRYNDLVTRAAVYETDNALEVDQQENFEIARKRVFFEDVLLVTMHEKKPLLAIFTSFAFAGLLFLIGAIDGGSAGAVIALFGALLLAYGIARIARPDTVITVFGRRSRARIRFSLRRERAHRLYDELCAHIRRTQTEVTANDLDQNDSVREG